MTWTPPAIEFRGYELNPETIRAIRADGKTWAGPSWEHEHALSLLLHDRDSRLSAHDWSTIISAEAVRSARAIVGDDNEGEAA